jgi:tight adherence protein B
MIIYLLAAAVLAIALALLLIFRDMWDRRQAYWERRWEKPEDDQTGNTLAKLAARKPANWSGRLDEAFQKMIERTGLPLTPQQALGAMLLTGAAIATGLILWREDYYLGAAGLVLGFLLPLIYFLVMQSRWRQRLQDQLPDAFFLLARSMRAGLSLEQALSLVGEQGVKPLANEFRRCAEQTRLGLTVATALRSMADHIRLTDMNVFVSVVSLHRQVGGNLGLLLDRVAAATRDRNQFRGQFQASTALGRATGFFISLAAPVLLLIYVVLQPDYLIKFAQSPTGLAALAIAGVLQIIGALWIFYLLRVDY